MRYRVAALAAIVCGAVSVAEAAPRTYDPVRFKDCLVQEMRAPFPAEIARASIPEGWGLVPYGSTNAELVTAGGTTLSCTYRGSEVVETWWWTEVVPPARYRARTIESYGFLLVAASTAPELKRTPRSCLAAWLAPAEIAVDEVAGFPRTVHTVTRSRWGTDESYVEGSELATLATNSWRFFSSTSPSQPGYDPAYPLSSFDARLDAEEALAGRALFGQNVNDPSIDPWSSSVAVPGYFTGDGLLIESDVVFTGTGPAACR